MKCLLLFTALLALSAEVMGQQVAYGGFGYFMTGPSLLLSQKVDDYLQRQDVLGASYSYPVVGIIAGGEGSGILNKVLIGGGGYGISNFRQSGDSASVLKSGGGGYFKAGYVCWSKKKSIMHLSMGFGGYGYQYEIRNERSQNGVYFNQEFPVRIGEVREYTYGGTLFDFSYGIKSVVTGAEDGAAGGLLIGIDAGCSVNVALGEWSGYEDNIIGPPSPGVSAVPYIRFCIGGGAFAGMNE